MEKDFRKRRGCFLKSFLYVNLPENLAGLFLTELTEPQPPSRNSTAPFDVINDTE